MATVTRTWSFPADTMGLAPASGGSTSVAFAWINDGNPPGAVRFTTTSSRLSNATLTARVPSPTDTWATWGVPDGATVTGLTVTGWQKKQANSSGESTASFKIDVVDASGAIVHPGGDLISTSVPAVAAQTAYSAGAAGPLVAVDTAHQASGTVVGLQLTYVVSTFSGGGQNVDHRFDEIALEITYTPAGGGGPPAAATPAALLMAM